MPRSESCIVTGLLIAIAACIGPAQADVVVLAGGDRITGVVKKLASGKLEFQSAYAADSLQIAWRDVTALTTDTELQFILDDGTRPTGKLNSSPTGLTILQTGAATLIRTADILELQALTSKEAERASGLIHRLWNNSSVSADIDQSYSGLTQYNQFSSNSEIAYEGDRWDGTLSIHYEYYGPSEATSSYQSYGRLVAQRYLRGDRFFLFPYTFLGRQTGETGNGQIRQYGGGAGWTFRRHQPDEISLYAGIIRSTGNGYSILPDEARTDLRLDDPLFIAALSWDGKLKRGIVPSVRLYYSKPLVMAGHHAIATDASIKIPIFGPAYFTIHAYDTPELRQRQLFSTKNLKISSGIGIEF